MDDIKKLIRRGIITAIIILLLGIISNNEYIYLGMSLGAFLSVLGFYMICINAKATLISKSPFRVGITGYLKRYVIYGVFLTLATKLYGFPMLVCGVIGLLNIKTNILVMALLNRIKKFTIKHLK